MKQSITERRRTALFNWACGQSAKSLASLLIYVLSNTAVRHLCEDNNLNTK